MLSQLEPSVLALHLDAITREEERRAGQDQEDEDVDALKAASRGGPKPKAKAS